jgi:hypothetical protein
VPLVTAIGWPLRGGTLKRFRSAPTGAKSSRLLAFQSFGPKLYGPSQEHTGQAGHATASGPAWKWVNTALRSGVEPLCQHPGAQYCNGTFGIGARRSRYRLVVLSRWLGWLAAAAVMLVACILVVLDLTDDGLRRWWDRHALTTYTIAGLGRDSEIAD